MFDLKVLVIVGFVLANFGASCCPEIVSRRTWGAKEVTRYTPIARPVSYIIVHHTRTPKCITRRNCEKMMRSLQNIHMQYNGRQDIGYNFLIGEDGHIYEGVGWDRAANNTPQYDRDSLHIAVMGDYTSWLPGTKALNVMKELVKCAVSKEAVYTNYQLLGHRQLQSRDCPGSRLQQEIKQWPHWGLY